MLVTPTTSGMSTTMVTNWIMYKKVVTLKRYIVFTILRFKVTTFYIVKTF